MQDDLKQFLALCLYRTQSFIILPIFFYDTNEEIVEYGLFTSSLAIINVITILKINTAPSRLALGKKNKNKYINGIYYFCAITNIIIISLAIGIYSIFNKDIITKTLICFIFVSTFKIILEGVYLELRASKKFNLFLKIVLSETILIMSTSYGLYFITGETQIVYYSLLISSGAAILIYYSYVSIEYEFSLKGLFDCIKFTFPSCVVLFSIWINVQGTRWFANFFLEENVTKYMYLSFLILIPLTICKIIIELNRPKLYGMANETLKVVNCEMKYTGYIYSINMLFSFILYFYFNIPILQILIICLYILTDIWSMEYIIKITALKFTSKLLFPSVAGIIISFLILPIFAYSYSITGLLLATLLVNIGKLILFKNNLKYIMLHNN